ncbi:MAG: Ig domain-containing protein [Firmicutes bacterium]|nr:Ig domain-containing protein [Bacillota bacterium]
MKFKKAMAFALTGALTAGAVCSGVFADGTTTVKLTVADPYDTEYVLTVPAEVNVAQAGFNATDGIKVEHKAGLETTFSPEKKVSVTATSGNDWQLKATSVADGIGYKLKATDTDENATTAWEFTSDEVNAENGTTKAVGVDVENYDDAAPGEYTDTITFTAEVESSAVAVTGITLNKTETSIQVGNNETLSVTAVTPDDATNKTVTWSSDNTDVATVDADGKVTAVATGTANITATANDGSGVTATCAVTVTAAVPAYYNKLTKINDNFMDQVTKLKYLGRGYESYNSSLTAAQAWELAKYQAAIDNVTVYVIMSSQDDGYDIHYSVSTDTTATEHTADLYDIANGSNRMYYIAQ